MWLLQTGQGRHVDDSPSPHNRNVTSTNLKVFYSLNFHFNIAYIHLQIDYIWLVQKGQVRQVDDTPTPHNCHVTNSSSSSNNNGDNNDDRNVDTNASMNDGKPAFFSSFFYYFSIHLFNFNDHPNNHHDLPFYYHSSRRQSPGFTTHWHLCLEIYLFCTFLFFAKSLFPIRTMTRSRLHQRRNEWWLETQHVSSAPGMFLSYYAYKLTWQWKLGREFRENNGCG